MSMTQCFSFGRLGMIVRLEFKDLHGDCPLEHGDGKIFYFMGMKMELKFASFQIFGIEQES